MISLPEEVGQLFSKWKSDDVPLLVAFTSPSRASFRFEGRITELLWPTVRAKGGLANFVIDLSRASFEYEEPRDAAGEFAEVLKAKFISLVRASFPDGAECFFGERKT